MISIVFIKDWRFPQTVSVAKLDTYIGVQNDTGARSVYFCLPKRFNDIAIDTSLSVVVQVTPVNKDEKSYLDLLTIVSQAELNDLSDFDKRYLTESLVENCLFYKWQISEHNTKVSGTLTVNLKILDTENNIRAQTYVSEFIVSPTVTDFENDIAELSIWEQAVAEATKQANIAKQKADEILTLIVDAAGHTIVDSGFNEYPQRKKLQFMGDVVINDDTDGDTTKVFITGSGGGTDGTNDHSKLMNLSYADSKHTGFAPAGNYATIVYNNSHLEFPNQGDFKNIYIDMSSNKIYRWDSSNLKYYELGANFSDIKIISGGGASG